jgi:hypothetical protein
MLKSFAASKVFSDKPFTGSATKMGVDLGDIREVLIFLNHLVIFLFPKPPNTVNSEGCESVQSFIPH